MDYDSIEEQEVSFEGEEEDLPYSEENYPLDNPYPRTITIICGSILLVCAVILCLVLIPVYLCSDDGTCGVPTTLTTTIPPEILSSTAIVTTVPPETLSSTESSGRRRRRELARTYRPSVTYHDLADIRKKS